jgi:hypothetical protein
MKTCGRSQRFGPIGLEADFARKATERLRAMIRSDPNQIGSLGIVIELAHGISKTARASAISPGSSSSRLERLFSLRLPISERIANVLANQPQ